MLHSKISMLYFLELNLLIKKKYRTKCAWLQTQSGATRILYANILSYLSANFEIDFSWLEEGVITSFVTVQIPSSFSRRHWFATLTIPAAKWRGDLIKWTENFITSSPPLKKLKIHLKDLTGFLRVTLVFSSIALKHFS